MSPNQERPPIINASICIKPYRTTNRPIVVDISADAVKVVNADATPRKQRLSAVKAHIEAAKSCPQEIQPMHG